MSEYFPSPDLTVGSAVPSHPLTRSEWVDQQLRKAILQGEYAPGERLILSDLTARLDVSPTPLREALWRLAAEGLVELTPQRGARVAPVSTEDLRDLYETRQLLEPPTLRRAIERGDDSYRSRVEAAFESMQSVYQREPLDIVACEWAHRAFHIAILSSSGSDWRLRMIGVLINHSARYRLLSRTYRGGVDQVIREHARMRDACFSQEAEVGGKLLEAHLQYTLDTAMTGLDEGDN